MKKDNKYNCKWNEPWKNAPWSFESCNCPERRAAWRAEDTDIHDISCDDVDCGYFEKEK